MNLVILINSLNTNGTKPYVKLIFLLYNNLIDMEITTLLLVLFSKTDNNGVFADYKLKFPSMKECLEAVSETKFTVPASENETSLAFVCVPEQEITHQRGYK